MKRVYDAGVNGMTVNFPDKLKEYIREKKKNKKIPTAFLLPWGFLYTGGS